MGDPGVLSKMIAGTGSWFRRSGSSRDGLSWHDVVRWLNARRTGPAIRGGGGHCALDPTAALRAVAARLGAIYKLTPRGATYRELGSMADVIARADG